MRRCESVVDNRLGRRRNGRTGEVHDQEGRNPVSPRNSRRPDEQPSDLPVRLTQMSVPDNERKVAVVAGLIFITAVEAFLEETAGPALK